MRRYDKLNECKRTIVKHTRDNYNVRVSALFSLAASPNQECLIEGVSSEPVRKEKKKRLSSVTILKRS